MCGVEGGQDRPHLGASRQGMMLALQMSAGRVVFDANLGLARRSVARCRVNRRSA
ncbi:MAG: hypothetical protein QM718_11895 [Steroidobacteraceae bacterium]